MIPLETLEHQSHTLDVLFSIYWGAQVPAMPNEPQPILTMEEIAAGSPCEAGVLPERVMVMERKYGCRAEQTLPAEQQPSGTQADDGGDGPGYEYEYYTIYRYIMWSGPTAAFHPLPSPFPSAYSSSLPPPPHTDR